MIAALIPAAGKGERLGRGPKAFLPLDDDSILHHTLKAFQGQVDECVVAVSPDMLSDVKAHVPTSTRVIIGGSTRQETVYKLLKATQAEIVLIHDAARPFLSSEIVKASIQAARACGAATVIRSVADTLIDHQSLEVIDRSRLLAVQTPQSFRRELILKAHELARSRAIEATDDAALIRLLGHEVRLVQGSGWLNKITTLEDYDIARALINYWQKQS